MNKTYRQGQIVRIIKSKKVLTQDQLAHELAEQGIHVTQVTLSRDIRELALVKTPDGYRQVEARTGPDFATTAEGFLWDATVAQNLVVLKTAAGHANSLAIALDQEEWPEVVGTLAGDDTVLIVTPDRETAKSVQKKLLTYMSE